MILELVIPFYLIAGVCIVLACSPAKDDSLARYLQRVIHPITGKHLYKTIALIEVCAECKKKQIPEACTHMLLNKSELKTHERTLAAMAMYPPEYKDVGEREILGMPSRPMGHLTDAEISDFMTSAPYDIEFAPNAVFIGIDPGGGGKSHTGICVFIYYPTPSIPNMRLVSVHAVCACETVYTRDSAHALTLGFNCLTHWGFTAEHALRLRTH